MGRDATEIERAVARSLRDSLEKLQRTTDDVNQAIGDLVSACSSARPGNTLPHILRAQTAAASLAATLDVLSRFITSAMQPGWNSSPSQQEAVPEGEPAAPVRLAVETAVPITAPEPMSVAPAPQRPSEPEPEPAAVADALRSVESETAAFEEVSIPKPLPVVEVEPVSVVEVQVSQAPVEREAFDLASLPIEQQELHRRANRVAKVSMQDIKMLRPGDVRAGKENNDLCARLRDDIERAHKEYERRFHAILDHPVDYFYAWMVEILGEGDPRALGEYPYPSAVARR